MNRWAFDPAFVQRVAGALLHFVWQGAAIAAGAAVCLRMLTRASAEVRYLVSVSGLAGMLAAPVLTFVLYDRIGQATLRAIAWAGSGHPADAVAASPVLMYWIVGLWSAGVIGCTARLTFSWSFSRRLLRWAAYPAPEEVAGILSRAAALIGIDAARKKIRLLVSAAVDSPVVVGWIRPAILVPVSALTKLTGEQLTAVMVHELAHIRRHDFLANIVQTCVESLLFYHPAVWWMSGQVRAEREKCCDDLAVRACGNRREYVQALVALERARPGTEILAVSASGGSLKERVQRLLGVERPPVDWRPVLATVAFLCVGFAAGIQPAKRVGPMPSASPVLELELAAVLPELAPGGAATVLSTVAAIATAQPVVPVAAEVQAPAEPGVVTGILRTSTNMPLPEVRVAVTPVDPPIAFGALERLGLTVLTDTAGRYRVQNIAPGRYKILIGVNGPRFFYPGVSDPSQAAVVEVPAGRVLEVPDTVVGGGAVSGRVMDTVAGAGRRLDNLVLCCDYFRELRYGQPGQIRQASPFRPVLSEDGSFVFPFVPQGNYVLSVLDRVEIPLSWMLAVGPAGISGLQLDLSEGVQVRGTILDEAGKPVPASVRLVPNPGSRPAASAFETIGPATFAGDSPILFENGTNSGPRAFLRRILVTKADPSLDELQDRLREAVRAQVRSAKAGPDGRFSFTRVLPGPYVLELDSGSAGRAGLEIEVGLPDCRDARAIAGFHSTSPPDQRGFVGFRFAREPALRTGDV